MQNAQHKCTGPGVDNGTYTVTVESLSITGQGIEGTWNGILGDSCITNMRFAVVRN